MSASESTLCPHPKSIEAWNSIIEMVGVADSASFHLKVEEFILACRLSTVAEAHTVALDLDIRLRLSKRVGPLGKWTTDATSPLDGVVR